MMIMYLIGKSELPYLGGYYYFFSAGVIFAIQKNKMTKYSIISLFISLFLCIAFSNEYSVLMINSKNVFFSTPVTIFITCLFFMFFYFLNTMYGSSLKIPGSKIAGSLTYPLYLIHAHFGYLIISKFANNHNKILIYTITISLVIIFSLLIHFFIEIKFAKVWRFIFFNTIGKVLELIDNYLQLIWNMSKSYPEL